MNDDREVTCYALAQRQMLAEDVRDTARAAWQAQTKDGDDGCQYMAAQLVAARQFTAADLWQRARQSAEANRPRAARQALGLLPDGEAVAVLGEVFDQPLRYLARRPESGRAPGGAHQSELSVLALQRLAATDPAAAAGLMDERWQGVFSTETAAFVWGAIAKQAAMKLLPEAHDWFQRAAGQIATVPERRRQTVLSDDTLGWRVRAALRSTDPTRWIQILEAIEAMGGNEQREPAWVYWKARALQQTAAAGAEGEPRRLAANLLLERIATQYHFYGSLAAEDLGRPQAVPARPPALSAQERARAEQHPGLNRALQLIGIGLRGEGVREWNYALRDFKDDREFLAAAQRACEREIWDRCINTSERTQQQIDMAQRFPTPYRAEVTGAAREVGLDPAYVYGLIRQESRFIANARSAVGASGLMQVMPATAKWVARKLGIPYGNEQIADRSTNLKLGTGYLKLVLDDFGGSQALAAAAYNAGPGRPRRWREGPTLEVAAWAENVPFHETRDYVKKVLSNASIYHALMNSHPVVGLKSRLALPIGPRGTEQPAEQRDLP
jgi:soluble lytic murein transglycosylase